ncbi:hypothetical protein LHK_00954 [Laribacter hongkongensis HLHK9]|uniref:Uncharacterized protein n=1 Tax=Laribacter hongkongensis (strain HLHK9) TaxID=557598 RepID=C1D5C9_LARHH|nr:hypothetical protein LHK_00954 [Laribacter hongkongensis HLHK9]
MLPFHLPAWPGFCAGMHPAPRFTMTRKSMSHANKLCRGGYK